MRRDRSKIHDDEQAQTVTAFTRRALDWLLGHGIVAERLMTDNHFSYTKNRSFRQLLYRRAIQHIRTRPYTPRTNGKVERYQQTLQREWAYALEYASSEARRTSLPHWLRHYNERRTHTALGNRPPIDRVRNVIGRDTTPAHGDCRFSRADLIPHSRVKPPPTRPPRLGPLTRAK